MISIPLQEPGLPQQRLYRMAHHPGGGEVQEYLNVFGSAINASIGERGINRSRELRARVRTQDDNPEETEGEEQRAGKDTPSFPPVDEAFFS